jgi:hypothetical protein
MVPDPGIIKVPTEIDVFVLALSEVEGLALSTCPGLASERCKCLAHLDEL